MLDRGLNVRQTERLVQADKSAPGRSRPAARARTPTPAPWSASCPRRIGLKVTLKAAGNGGTLTIAYRTLDQLDALIARLRDGGGAPGNAADDVSAEIR